MEVLIIQNKNHGIPVSLKVSGPFLSTSLKNVKKVSNFTCVCSDISYLNRTGHTKSQTNLDLTLPNKFHQWFHPGVIHWLHISQYKALQGIQKAVQLDRFVPVYTATKCSSSACDILHIFVQVSVTS